MVASTMGLHRISPDLFILSLPLLIRDAGELDYVMDKTNDRIKWIGINPGENRPGNDDPHKKEQNDSLLPDVNLHSIENAARALYVINQITSVFQEHKLVFFSFSVIILTPVIIILGFAINI